MTGSSLSGSIRSTLPPMVKVSLPTRLYREEDIAERRLQRRKELAVGSELVTGDSM
jgi:hypothetical protein